MSCVHLHPVPDQPAPNYDRLGRVDDMGLIWLLRGRPIIALTATEAIIRCYSGATLKYRRTEPTPAEIAKVAPATGIVNAVAQITKPTLVQIISAISDAPEPALGHRTDDLLTTATRMPEAAQ
jgi:hypothetical protein